MKKNLLTLRRLATAIQEVQEIVAETKTMAVIKEDIILVIKVGVVIDVVDNTMPAEVATLVGETDQPR